MNVSIAALTGPLGAYGAQSDGVGCIPAQNADTMIRYTIEKAQYVQGPAAKAVRTARRRIAMAERDLGTTIKKENNRWAAECCSVGRNETVASTSPVAIALYNARATLRRGVRRCVMPIVRSVALVFAAAFSGVFSLGHAQAQSAIDAAQELAQMLDSAAVDLSGDNLLSALEGAASAGDPMALWQLGLMYESGTGVEQDKGRAFGYFAQIASENAEMSRSRPEADIVAQSFVKVGTYYSVGIPGANVHSDPEKAYRTLYHAATVFGDADAQYQLFMTEQENGFLPAQSARWLVLAARKGHPAAQARLGDLLFTGDGIEAQPVEGLMWLNLAYRRALGTGDEGWIRDLAEYATAHAAPAEIEAALRAADTLGPQFGSY